MRGGACTTKPLLDTSGRDAISSTNHDDVLKGTLGNTLGGMVGNLTFPHYNALAQTLSTVAENMVEDVMTEVLKEIDNKEIKRMVCEAFKRACYSTAWGSNPFIKDFTEETVEQDNPVEKIRDMIENGILEKIKATTGNSGKTIGQDNSTKEYRYNLLKIYMKNLGNESESDDMMMSFFSPHVFRHAISNMGLDNVVNDKLHKDNSKLKEKIIAKINATTEKLKKPEIMMQLKFEWVDKENFNRKPIPAANRKQSSYLIPRINIPLNLFLINNSKLPQ